MALLERECRTHAQAAPSAAARSARAARLLQAGAGAAVPGAPRLGCRLGRRRRLAPRALPPCGLQGAPRRGGLCHPQRAPGKPPCAAAAPDLPRPPLPAARRREPLPGQ
jgi:hypothetical protein